MRLREIITDKEKVNANYGKERRKKEQSDSERKLKSLN